jgi:hypothetical protein
MAEFDGRTPAQALAAPGGDVVVRSWLKEMAALRKRQRTLGALRLAFE